MQPGDARPPVPVGGMMPAMPQYYQPQMMQPGQVGFATWSSGDRNEIGELYIFIYIYIFELIKKALDHSFHGIWRKGCRLVDVVQMPQMPMQMDPSHMQHQAPGQPNVGNPQAHVPSQQ